MAVVTPIANHHAFSRYQKADALFFVPFKFVFNVKVINSNAIYLMKESKKNQPEGWSIINSKFQITSVR